MTVSATDFLTLAEATVSTQPLAEIAARCVVSRAYYAAYHDSESWHAALPFQGSSPPQSRGGHNVLCLCLLNAHPALGFEDRKKSIRRAALLRKFHGDRVRADYHLHESIKPDEAAQAVADAKVIMALV